MNLDLELLKVQAEDARKRAGVKWVSLSMELDVLEGCHPKLLWRSYSIETGHSAGHATAVQALESLVRTATDSTALNEQAAMLEEQARILRAKIAGGAQ